VKHQILEDYRKFKGKSQSRVKQALVKQTIIGINVNNNLSTTESQSRVKQALVKHPYAYNDEVFLIVGDGSQSRVKQALVKQRKELYYRRAHRGVCSRNPALSRPW